jgi:Ser/Thr protein kinase RdoA (MazF antagonist)
VTHAIVDAWCEEDITVIVMRDLGDRVLSWEDRLSAEQTRWVMGRVAALHRAFLAEPPRAVAPLEPVLDQFAPHRIGALVDTDNPLPGLAQRGWALFDDLVPRDVADLVLGVLADVNPYAAALLDAGPSTLVHGDLATVNMAFEGDDLVLLDWAMPVVAPGVLDVARFVAGCSSVVGLSREETIAAYREAAGPAYDETAMRLALLLGLVWLGWNKALDAVEHPDPETRARERDDLDWWVAQARTTLESGVL